MTPELSLFSEIALLLISYVKIIVAFHAVSTQNVPCVWRLC